MTLQITDSRYKDVISYKNSRNEDSFVKVYNQDGSNEIYIHAAMLKPEETPDSKQILESMAERAKYLNSLKPKK